MADARQTATRARRSYDAVIVGGSLAGCAAAMMLGRAGGARRGAGEEPRPGRVQADLLALHPGLGGADAGTAGAARADDGGGCGPLALPRARAVGVDRSAAGAGQLRDQPAAATLDPMVRGMAAATHGVEVLLGRTVRELRRAGGKVTGVVGADREGTEGLRGAAGDRRRRPRLDDRQARRGQGQDLSARALRLRRLLRGRRAPGRARRLGLADGPRLGGGLPHRRGPDLLRRDADQGAAARIQGRPRGGAGRLLRGGAGSALAARARGSASAACSARST